MPRKDRPPPKYKKVAWIDRYAELCLYRGSHGNCFVPFGWKENPRLGAWVAQQRQSYHRFLKNKPCGLMNPERIRLLEKIDFCWTLSKGTRTAEQKHIIKDWSDYFNELKEYQASHDGDTRVPQHYKENPPLGRWVNAQRTAYTHYQRNLKQIEEGTTDKTDPFVGTQLTKERFDLLSSLGFVWRHESCRLREMWETRYQQLLAFVKEHGHANVPTAKSPLGQWVKKQRQAYFKYMKAAQKVETQTRKRGSPTAMNEERIRLLEEAGFQWVPSQPAWLEKYKELQAFQKKHGHCNVPVPAKGEEAQDEDELGEDEDDDGEDDENEEDMDEDMGIEEMDLDGVAPDESMDMDKKPAAKKTSDTKEQKKKEGSAKDEADAEKKKEPAAADTTAKGDDGDSKPAAKGDNNKAESAKDSSGDGAKASNDGDKTAEAADKAVKKLGDDEDTKKKPAAEKGKGKPKETSGKASGKEAKSASGDKAAKTKKKKSKKKSSQSLYAWVQMQRDLYPKYMAQGGKRRPHDLTDARIKMLSDLGFDWGTAVDASAIAKLGEVETSADAAASALASIGGDTKPPPAVAAAELSEALKASADTAASALAAIGGVKKAPPVAASAAAGAEKKTGVEPMEEDESTEDEREEEDTKRAASQPPKKALLKKQLPKKKAEKPIKKRSVVDVVLPTENVEPTAKKVKKGEGDNVEKEANAASVDNVVSI